MIRILEFFQAFDEAVCIFFRSGPTGCQADDSVIGIIGFPHTVGDLFIEGGKILIIHDDDNLIGCRREVEVEACVF